MEKSGRVSDWKEQKQNHKTKTVERRVLVLSNSGFFFSFFFFFHETERRHDALNSGRIFYGFVEGSNA